MPDLRGGPGKLDRSSSEPAGKYGVYSNQILIWKKQAKEGIADFFLGKTKPRKRNSEADRFNTDQGSRFTSYEFTRMFREAGTRIPVDPPLTSQ